MVSISGPHGSATAPRREIRDVVLVEDNVTDQHLVHTYFHQAFASRRWRQFDHGRAALDACLTDAPELMLLDMRLPDFHGLEVLQMLRTSGHAFPVIVMTSLPEDTIPEMLLKLDAHGYLDKLALKTSLAAAVESVLNGRMFFCASRIPFAKTRRPKAPEVPQLSPREAEIARLVAHGFPSKHIANRLNISVRTVENHRARIMSRLGLVNVADLVRWCLRHGLG